MKICKARDCNNEFEPSKGRVYCCSKCCNTENNKIIKEKNKSHIRRKNKALADAGLENLIYDKNKHKPLSNIKSEYRSKRDWKNGKIINKPE